MLIDTERTVRDLVLEFPSAKPVFQRFGIDYCCGGGSSLEEACAKAGVSSASVLKAVEEDEALGNAYAASDRNWLQASLTDLIAHITGTHHVYTRNEIQRMQMLLTKVPSKHGERHPELYKVRDLFLSLSEELHLHLMKEEQILFPYIERLDEAITAGEPAPPAMFGSIECPINMMLHEHDSAGEILKQLSAITNGYSAPEDACDSFRSLYQALKDFEADLHQHIHLENNILFPRALAMANPQ